jgi:hypothetical protein
MGTPQLNIKDAETSKLVRELAETTGETQTQIVRRAVKELHAREMDDRAREAERSKADKQKELEQTWAEIQKIQERVRALRNPAKEFSEADLYDERGLPK